MDHHGAGRGGSDGDAVDGMREESSTDGGPPAYVLVPNPGIHRDAVEYPMDNPNRERGVALIFNHELFNREKKRDGTQHDVTRLQNTFQNLGFQVRCFNDLRCSAIMEQLESLAAENHENRDCVAIAVLTHGKEKGKIAARDMCYDVDELVKHFIPKNCRSLTGKPKLFIIQACKGDETDPGAMFTGNTCGDHTDDDVDDQVSYPVASYSDNLIMYATFEGQCAFRTAENGSWYVQTLCDQLDRHATELDLLSLLTRVNRIVSQGFRSVNSKKPKLHGMVQAPSFTSSLTRDLIFREKVPPQQQ